MKKRGAKEEAKVEIPSKRGKSEAGAVVTNVSGTSQRSNQIAVQLDFTVAVMDCTTQEKLKTLVDSKKANIRQHFCCLDQTGSKLATIDTLGTIFVWDTSSATLIQELHPPASDYSHGYCCFNPVFNHLAFICIRSSDEDPDKILIWDLSTGDRILTLSGHSAGVTSISYSNDGTKLASGSSDRSIRIWDSSTGALLQALSHDDQVVGHVSFSPDNLLLVSTAANDTIKIWNTSSWTCEKDYKSKYYVFEAKFAHDGRYLLVRYQYKLQVLNPSDNFKVIATIDKCKFFSQHPDGSRIAVIDKTNVCVYSIESGELLHTIEFPKSATLKSVACFPSEAAACILK